MKTWKICYHLSNSFKLLFICTLHLILQIWYFSFRIPLQGINLFLLITEFNSPFLSQTIIIWSRYFRTKWQFKEKIIINNYSTFTSANISSVYGRPPFWAMTWFTRERRCCTCLTLLLSSLVLLSKSTQRFSHRTRISYINPRIG